jgi:hypothetical protein
MRLHYDNHSFYHETNTMFLPFPTCLFVEKIGNTCVFKKYKYTKMLFLQKQAKRCVKYAIISFFVISVVSVLAAGYYTLSFLYPFSRVALLPIAYLLTDRGVSIGGTTDTTTNNTIYIVDSDTSCYKKSGCITRKSNPFMNITDYINAIEWADKTKPIKVVISTFGGLLSGCQRIVRRLRQHPAGYVAYCNEGISAGGVVTISANEIVMNKYSRIGKIDPVGGGGSARIMDALNNPDTTSIFPTSAFDILAKESTSVLNAYHIFLSENVPNWTVVGENVKKHLIYSDLDHGASFGVKEVIEMGFNVREPTSDEESLYFGYYQS